MRQVKIHDIENDVTHIGILLDDGSVVCGCCGGLIPNDEIGDGPNCTHKILDVYNEWENLDDMLLD